MHKFLAIWAYVNRGSDCAVADCCVLEAHDLVDAESMLDAVIGDPSWLRQVYHLTADDDCYPVFDSGIDAYRVIPLDDLASGRPLYAPPGTRILARKTLRDGPVQRVSSPYPARGPIPFLNRLRLRSRVPPAK